MLPFENSLQVKKAFNTTEKLIRDNSKTFYFATALLPKNARKAIRALYGFCRATDDLVDQDGATPEMAAEWRQKVKLPSSQQTQELLLAWSVVRELYQVNTTFENDLLDGVSSDISPRYYATWQDLETYCYKVASTVGLLSMPIIGLRKGITFEQAAPYAIRLGIALQLTNILRDIGEDAAHQRVYLPLVDLARFDLTPDDILAGVHDHRFIALVKFEIVRARHLYAESLPGIALLSPLARPAVGSAALLYQAILDEIEAIGYRVHLHRAHTTGWKKVRMLPDIIKKVFSLQPPLVEG